MYWFPFYTYKQINLIPWLLFGQCAIVMVLENYNTGFMSLIIDLMEIWTWILLWGKWYRNFSNSVLKTKDPVRWDYFGLVKKARLRKNIYIYSMLRTQGNSQLSVYFSFLCISTLSIMIWIIKSIKFLNRIQQNSTLVRIHTMYSIQNYFEACRASLMLFTSSSPMGILLKFIL